MWFLFCFPTQGGFHHQYICCHDFYAITSHENTEHSIWSNGKDATQPILSSRSFLPWIWTCDLQAWGHPGWGHPGWWLHHDDWMIMILPTSQSSELFCDLSVYSLHVTFSEHLNSQVGEWLFNIYHKSFLNSVFVNDIFTKIT